MLERCLYLAAVILVAWAVTFGLRALPFLLFAGRDRDLPPWVERLGNIISPIIIAGLIIYSYTGLEWRTAYPYIAGALTVGLQLWRRNPLLSILAGTILYMCLLACGCTTTRTFELDAAHPAVRVSTTGIYFGEERVEPKDVVEALEDSEVPHTRTIHILIDQEAARNLADAQFLMATLAKAGYTRPVLVTKRHAESEILKDKPRGKSAAARKNTQQAEGATKRIIRYKKANE
jgi:branched-subunit amino acid transport protein AzlD